MGKTIIPIGKSMGPVFNRDGKFENCELDLGNKLTKISADELMVWACAHENPEAHFERRFDRNALGAVIEQQNDTIFDDDRDRLIEQLLASGGFIEIDFEKLDVCEFLSAYKIMPLGRGFGNTAENPDKYGVGYGQTAEVFLGLHAYYIWGFSHQDGSIWAGCKQMAAENPKVTAEQVAESIATMIPVLIAADCAYLERL